MIFMADKYEFGIDTKEKEIQIRMLDEIIVESMIGVSCRAREC
jgi:hypothetical protein